MSAIPDVRDVARRRPWETLLLAILVVTIVYNIAESTNYLGVDNLVNLFELSIEKVIVAVIMTFVIVAGEIDLSVASTMGLSAAVLAKLHDGGSVPFVIAIVMAIGVGTLAGLVQGWCVAKLGLPSLVVTLGGEVLDAGPTQVEQLQAGTVDALIAQHPYDIGRTGVEMAVEYLTTQQAPEETLVTTGYSIVTNETIDDPEVARYLYVADCSEIAAGGGEATAEATPTS